MQIFFNFKLPFCDLNVIDYFLCDLNPLLNNACTDTHTLGSFVVANSGFLCLLNFLLLMGSYGVILHSVRSHSLEARCKAFSICVSPIIVVIIPLVPCTFVYLRPSVTLPIDKTIAVFYIPWEMPRWKIPLGICVIDKWFQVIKKEKKKKKKKHGAQHWFHWCKCQKCITDAFNKEYL